MEALFLCSCFPYHPRRWALALSRLCATWLVDFYPGSLDVVHKTSVSSRAFAQATLSLTLLSRGYTHVANLPRSIHVARPCQISHAVLHLIFWQWSRVEKDTVSACMRMGDHMYNVWVELGLADH